MAKIIKPLTIDGVLRLKLEKASGYTYKAVDNDGLYVRIGKASKAWVMRSKTGWTVLGPVDTEIMPLKNARDRVRELQLEAIKNPESKIKPMPFFKAYQDIFIEKICKTLKKDRHGNTKNGDQWTSTILKFCMNPDPKIGWDISKKRIDEITATDIAEIMERVLPLVPTADKLRGRLERIIDAAWTEYRTGIPYSNPASSKVVYQLVPVLAKETKLIKKKAKHHMAVPAADAPKIFQECWKKRKSSVAMSALCFTVLTIGRAGNGAQAKWSEIDWDDKAWIPESMKVENNPTHIAPLTPRALEILELRKALSDDDCEWIFASTQPKTYNEPITTDAMRSLLQKMTKIAYTTHGWRSTYKNWSMDDDDEQNDIDMISELALAHKVNRSGDITTPKESRLQKAMLGKKIGDDTYLAYMRSGLFKKRRKHSQEWEDFLFSKID